jgi:hypothetical protein
MEIKTGFYNLKTLNKKQLKKFFEDALHLAYNAHVDKLDCNVSWARQSTDERSLGEMIDRCSPTYHNICIDRSVQHSSEKYGEIGYNIISEEPSFFLYIYITLENLKILVDRYGLNMK